MFSCFIKKKKTGNIIIVVQDTTTLFDSSEHHGLPVDRLSKQEYQARLASKNQEEKEVSKNELENTKGTPEFFKKQKAQHKLDKKMQSEAGYQYKKNPLVHA